ncbi:MAG: Peptidylprolyl isomerase [Ignavibacteria bacterium]|nr:Peptidylprolyl isomerase [Ignavibacteria bacterium]
MIIRKKIIKPAVLGLFFFWILLIFPQSALAQLQEGTPVDKIIAVVGDEIILESDLAAKIMFLANQDKTVKLDDPKLRLQVLDAMINEKLLVAKAIEDSVEVSDEEVKQRWDYLIQMYIRQYGSEKRVESVFGMSIKRMQYEYSEIIKKQLLSEKLRRSKFQGISVSPREVEDFFANFKDSLPKIPTQVELYHIVRYVKSNNLQKEEIQKLAQRVRDSLIKGGDFADFAKRYSGDAGTASAGGDLGWFDKGKLFPEFENAAFALQKDEISMPVETPFGFHLIQTLEKKKDAVNTRHILFKIGQNASDVEETKTFLLNLKKRAEAGENFEVLAKEYSEDKDTRGFGGFIGKASLEDLQEFMKDVVAKLPDGGLSEPQAYNADPQKPAYHILFKKKMLMQHTANIKDDYQQIESIAKEYKQNKLFMEWIESLRKTMYWEIK